ncbi:uncharacterized protein G2W53_019103 [Senna tora]|uniref:Uncharacterized protein n=1 Tax=Senna tora TaxID=362788 RepID=A0A834U1N5_9FABA|nr:uncharacterized protein G2W53_019103 [Senna tora]
MDECLEATEKIAWMNLRICDKNRRFDEASTVLNNSSSTAGGTADSASTMDSVSLFSALKVDLREGAFEMDGFGGMKMVYQWVSWHLILKESISTSIFRNIPKGVKIDI